MHFWNFISSLCLCMIALGSNPTSGDAKDTVTTKDLTQFPKAYGAHRPKGAKWCTGEIKNFAAFKSFPALETRLKKGAACLSADFDGNKIEDFAILSTGWDQDTDGTASADVFILLFDKNGWMSSLTLPKAVSLFSTELYPPTEKKGPFDEPSTKVPGIVDHGEGGTTKIFLYDPSTKKFKKTEHASENN